MPKIWTSLKAWVKFLVGPNESRRINAIVYVLQTSRFQEDDIVAEKILSALDDLGAGRTIQISREDFDVA